MHLPGFERAVPYVGSALSVKNDQLIAVPLYAMYVAGSPQTHATLAKHRYVAAPCVACSASSKFENWHVCSGSTAEDPAAGLHA